MHPANRKEPATGARDALGFRRVAQVAFDFLESDFGFRMVESDQTFLRYESESVVVNVYHGRSSFVVRFEIGLLKAPESKYYREEIVALSGATEDVFFQASTTERVALYVQKLADVLRRCGANLLAGEKAAFAEVQKVRDRLATDVTQGYWLSTMRERAAIA